MNKQSGNMYEDITHTSNPIKGNCVFDCLRYGAATSRTQGGGCSPENPLFTAHRT